MKKHATRIISLLLSLTMIVGLAACGKSGDVSKSGQDGKVTLTIGLPLKSNVSDYENNYFTQWLEEYTGYDIEFMFFSSTAGEAKTQLATMVAGGEELPDLFYNIQLNTDERASYGADGYFLDLRSYLEDEKLTADYRARIQELFGDEYYDEMLRAITSPDNGIYGYPTAVISESDLPHNMVYINQTWLDKLGLEKPTTWDEMVTVLRAFRDQDPNGNGIKDEVPMVGANITRCRMGNWLINNFERVHDQYYFNLDENGKLWLPYISDNYRKGLQAIRELVKEDLLSELTWSMNQTSEISAVWSPADNVPIAGIIGAHISSHMPQNSPLMYDYEPLMPMEGSYAPRQTTVASTSCYISADTEYPDECFNLLMAISTEEGSMAMRYGKQGEDWEWVQEYGSDNIGVDVINSSAFAGTTHSTWGVGAAFALRYSMDTKYHTAIQNAPEDMTWSEVRTSKAFEYAKGYMAINEATDPEGSVNWITTYNAEEANEMGNIMSEIYTYVRNSMGLFCTGDLDPYNDNDWNTYVKNIKNMGIDTWERLGQQAYDRYMAG